MGDENNWNDWNTRVWWLQILVVCGWAGLIGLMWLGWTAESMRNIDPGNDAGVGVAAMLTTGCCGFTWVIGLVPIVLCFAILKR